MTRALFTPIQVGEYTLQHRVVMAPLTRIRADVKTSVPSPLTAEYYAQRASDGGLLVTEATFIAPEAHGLPGAPGIWSAEQIEAWKPVTQAVHAKKGIIFLQLWAHGRVAHPKAVPAVKGPSDDMYEADGTGKSVKVTAMTEAEIDRFVEYYAQAARNAIAAGFDGVELHGANGYVLDQFLQSVSNKRTDSYGGSIENRLRFPLRVLNACCEAIGAGRVGIRTSPFGRVQGMRGDKDPYETFIPWVQAIADAQPRLAYVHAVGPRANGTTTLRDDKITQADDLDPFRQILKNKIPFMVAGAYGPENAIADADKTGDLIAFGRWFISNPDLPERLAKGWQLAKYDRPTFYTPGAKGYIDYPTYKGAQARL